MTDKKQNKPEAPAKQGVDSAKLDDSGDPTRKAPLIASHNFSRPKIKPVPGVPPHLWHRHQGRRIVIKDPTGKSLDLTKLPASNTPAQSVQQPNVTPNPSGPNTSGWGDAPQADSSKTSPWESNSQTGWGPQVTEADQPVCARSQNSNVCPHNLKGDEAVHQDSASENSWAAKKKPWQSEKKPGQAEKESVQAEKRPGQTKNKPRPTEKKRGAQPVPAWKSRVPQELRPPPVPADYMDHAIPCRRRSWTGSRRSRLSVSDFHFSDGHGPDDVEEVNPNLTRDIRSKIGVKVPMYRFNDELGRPRLRFGHFYESVDYDIGLQYPNYNKGFVRAWVKDVTANAKACLKSNRDHFKCDINPETGCLLAPVSYPETRVGETEDPELRWRQLNWSSEVLRKRKLASMRGGKSYRGEVPPSSRQLPKVLNMAELNVPEVPCHLRPATAADMGAVASIYNSEAIQKFDSAPLQAADFEKILMDTHGHEFPFVVAISGSARVETLKEGIRFESSQPQQQIFPPNLTEGVVLGFAYLSVWKPGLAGSHTGTGRATAEAHLYVHTSWRRKRIGSALLDRLLASVSLSAKSKGMCDFWDPLRNPAYVAPCHHNRYTFKIYMQYLVKAEIGANNGFNKTEAQENQTNALAWVKKLLETDFDFKERFRFEAAFRTPKVEGEASSWLDSVVFEHTCCSLSWVDLLY